MGSEKEQEIYDLLNSELDKKETPPTADGLPWN